MMHRAIRWLGRTPVQTFVLCPAVVIAVELVLRGGDLVVRPWGAVLLAGCALCHDVQVGHCR